MTTHSSILVWKIPWTEEPDKVLDMTEVTEHACRDQEKVLRRVQPAAQALCHLGHMIQYIQCTGHSPVVTVRSASSSVNSVAQSCPTLCDPMNLSRPGLPIHHQLPESTQTHVHGVSDGIQPSYLSSPSPPTFNLSQHQGLLR